MGILGNIVTLDYELDHIRNFDNQETPVRAIFLDRDGVICENRSDYVKSWREFQFLPGAKESLAALSRLGLPIIVVTNQSAIGRGIVSAEVIEDIHRRMIAEIEAYGGRIDRVIYCPHRPDDRCRCRKPEAGMLLHTAAELEIDLSQSYMVGDAASDLMAGQTAGCRTFLVLTGRGLQQLVPAFRSTTQPFNISRDLAGATRQILETDLPETENNAVDYWQLRSAKPPIIPK